MHLLNIAIRAYAQIWHIHVYTKYIVYIPTRIYA